MELTDERIVDLTDGELVEHHRSVLAEIERLAGVLSARMDDVPHHHEMRQAWVRWRAEYWLNFLEGLPRSQSRLPTDREARFSMFKTLRKRLEREMDVRLGGMLRGARIFLGLAHRDVGRVAGMHSRFVDEIERGRGGSPSRCQFERACTEGGLETIDASFHRSVWFPLADPRICRTIREVAIDPSWLSNSDGAAVTLARSIREGRDFHLLPVLGDALEEAGCVDAAILDHCRDPGEHARGCWVVDALVRAARRA